MNRKAYELLSRRGIQNAAQQMKWTYQEWYGQAGYAYPVNELDTNGQLTLGKKPVRFKSADSKGNYKYAWVQGEAKNYLPIYCSPKFQEAVALTQGIVFAVEGEPDLLTMLEAGFENSFTWLGGAKAVPDDLVEIFQQLGVTITTIIQIPDLDETGLASASRLATLLHPHNIEYKALKLPDELGNKGDVNDLWQKCGFDSNLFRETLNSLPLLDVAIEANDTAWFEPVRPKTSVSNNQYPKTLPEGFYRAIEQALGAKGYNHKGFSDNVLCPFHPDHNPSATWNRDSHVLYCHRCKVSFSAESVAEELNINWKDYTERRTPMNGDMYDDLIPPTGDEVGDEVPTNAKKPKVTDDEIGDYLIKIWDGDNTFMYGQWHVYSNGYWKIIDKKAVFRFIWDAMKELKIQKVSPDSRRRASVEEYLQSMLFVPDELTDSYRDYCNLQNGLFNLKTGELEPHRRDLYITSQLSFEYDSEATCPKWISFLNEAFQGNVDLINLMQEAVGYTLTSYTNFEVMFWLGGEAATGKSTVIRLLKRLFGSSSVELDLNTVTKNTYQNVDIFGKRLVTCSEVESGSRLADSFIKRLVSGEEQVFRQIYGLTKRGETSAKLWWAMNELPSNMDKSSAIYRRLILIPFKNPIPKEKRNLRLIDELTEELAGIFNWALVGLKRLLERGYFPDVQEVAEAVEEYRLSNDTERLFLEDEEWIIQHDDASVKASELYMAFQLWAERNGHRNIPTSTKAGKEWTRLGLQKIKNGSNFYLGVSLSDSAMNMVETEKMKSGENRK